jgi:hypothetical protein|tara:strand:- start:723 stop:995 length:273 start_codon:yes stop_codon:yes gene_type:complete
MDGRINNKGTKGNKGGRPSKAEEQKLIENLTPMNADALKSLQIGLKNKEQWAVKLFFEYFYGKPQQRVDVTSNSETLNIPIINFVESETE